MTVRDVVVVGGSTAGATAMRELRRRGHDGPIVLLDPADGTNRPPLSKGVLGKDDDPSTVLMNHAALQIDHVRRAASSLDPDRHRVIDEEGDSHHYDALVIAAGSRARTLAAPGQHGEHVLRTVDDAVALRNRFRTASTVIVVGAGFLGLEVATAAANAGADVLVIDRDPPLQRLTGEFLSRLVMERAQRIGIAFLRSAVTLIGSPVHGVRLDDGTTREADVVVSCVGDVPAADWLAGTPLESPLGVEIDAQARTAIPGVLAAGDIAAVRRDRVVTRGPFWANAVAQGRVAAGSILGRPHENDVTDHYFWTEIAGVSLKAVGPLPLVGAPTVLEDAGDGAGLYAWEGPSVVAFGINRSLPRLRKTARELDRLDR